MKVELAVKVQGQYCNAVAAVEIAPLMCRQFEPMTTTDEPLLASVTGDLIADSPAARTHIALRKDAAEILATTLTKMIISEMSKSDKHNGYAV